MPAGTVIGDPLWWAPKIRKALQSGEPSEWVIEVENGQVVMSRIGANFTGYLYTTPQPVVPEGYVLVPRAAVTEVLRISDRQHPAWEEVRTALLRAGKGGDSHAPEMKTYRCVICNVSGTDDGLCDAHKYDEQLSKHKSAGKGGGE
jgi:hypothetical protein